MCKVDALMNKTYNKKCFNVRKTIQKNNEQRQKYVD